MEEVRPRLLLAQSKLSSRDMLAHVSLKPLSLRSLHKRTLRLSRLLTRVLVSEPFTSSACSSLRLERREQTDGRLLPAVEPAVEELRLADRLAMRPSARIALPVFYNTHIMPRACMQLEHTQTNSGNKVIYYGKINSRINFTLRISTKYLRPGASVGF